MTYDATKDPVKLARNQAQQGIARRAAESYALAHAIVPSDTVDLTAYAAGLIVTVGGNLKILPSQNADAATVTFTAVVAGQVIPIQTRRVFATGTTASVASLDV
jgi:hypothetical protein